MWCSECCECCEEPNGPLSIGEGAWCGCECWECCESFGGLSGVEWGVCGVVRVVIVSVDAGGEGEGGGGVVVSAAWMIVQGQ